VFAGGGEPGAKFDPGKMITDHITDAHDWHLWGEGHESVSIPLPVIVYSSRGLDVFMSSSFHHGHDVYNGYALKDKKLVAVNELSGAADSATIDEAVTASLWDFSITKNVVSLFVSMFILLYIFLSVAKAYKSRPGQAPRGLQGLIEPLVIFVRDDVAAAITFVLVLVNGNKHYWHHILAMPGVPGWVLVLLTPIEILGIFLRPFVLMIRLFANITAGHIIALSFFSLIFIFGEMSAGAGLGVSILSISFTVFMTCLELLVAFLQAYVFTLLSAIYIGAAVEEPHHDHH